jgi:predicted AlkP superfamily pyrophosphatase or phosphodiesterase
MKKFLQLSNTVFFSFLLIIISFVILLACNNSSSNNATKADHIILIGVDGMSPFGIMNAATPNLDMLMKNGSYSFHTRAVLPSSSSSN